MTKIEIYRKIRKTKRAPHLVTDDRSIDSILSELRDQLRLPVPAVHFYQANGRAVCGRPCDASVHSLKHVTCFLCRRHERKRDAAVDHTWDVRRRRRIFRKFGNDWNMHSREVSEWGVEFLCMFSMTGIGPSGRQEPDPEPDSGQLSLI